MTNEEREKEIIKQPIPTKEECLAFYEELTKLEDVRFVPYYKMAIEALEQQPCEDAISREYTIALLENKRRTRKEITNRIYEAPSVIPQPKIGHWIYTPERRLVDETDEGRIYITDYRCTCSECGGDFGFQKMSDAYCKYCGAKMEVKEE